VALLLVEDLLEGAKPMIIFFESGQLGNQLFQYCALKSMPGKGPLYLIGMQSLKTIFLGVEVAGGKKLDKFIERLIRFLGQAKIEILARKFRLFGLIEEQQPSDGSWIQQRRGFLKDIYYCDSAYFQSEDLHAQSVASTLELRPDLSVQATSIFKDFPQDRTETFFVHVRRGDYFSWPSTEAPAVLPPDWYQAQMDMVRSRCGKPFFVVVSDEAAYADEVFADCLDVYVSHESQGVDFALMAKCDGGGVLSPSSFSWWGACFVRRANKDAFFVAPLFWGGHRKGEWHPEGVETSWINYVAV